jgi:hypothetical protein
MRIQNHPPGRLPKRRRKNILKEYAMVSAAGTPKGRRRKNIAVSRVPSPAMVIGSMATRQEIGNALRMARGGAVMPTDRAMNIAQITLRNQMSTVIMEMVRDVRERSFEVRDGGARPFRKRRQTPKRQRKATSESMLHCKP